MSDSQKTTMNGCGKESKKCLHVSDSPVHSRHECNQYDDKEEVELSQWAKRERARVSFHEGGEHHGLPIISSKKDGAAPLHRDRREQVGYAWGGMWQL